MPRTLLTVDQVPRTLLTDATLTVKNEYSEREEDSPGKRRPTATE